MKIFDDNIYSLVQAIIKDEMPVFKEFFFDFYGRSYDVTKDNIERFKGYVKETHWRLCFGVMQPNGSTVYDSKPKSLEIRLGDMSNFNKFKPGMHLTSVIFSKIVEEELRLNSGLLCDFLKEIKKEI